MNKVGWILGLLVLATVVQAEDFNLYGTDHLDVTSSYSWGRLYQSSSTRILPNGQVNWLYAYDSSSVDVNGGRVDYFVAENNSTVSVSSGEVGRLWTYDSSTVMVSGGNVGDLNLSSNSAATISGGQVGCLSSDELVSGGPQRISVTGGTIETFCAEIYLRGNEQLNYTAAGLSRSDLAGYGVQLAEGTVNQVYTDFRTQDTSRLDISGGSLNWVEAMGNSHVTLTEGHIGSISANQDSAVTICAGSIDRAYARGSSTMTVTGGSIDELDADQLQYGGPTRVAVTGGSVGTLHSRIEVSGDQELNYTGENGLADFGVQMAEGTVHQLDTSLSALDTSRLTFSGGNLEFLSARDNSRVTMAGGHAERLYSGDNSAVAISGGDISWITDIRGNSTASVSGGHMDYFSTSDNSAVTVSDGSMNRLAVWDLHHGGPQRVTVTGGTVDGLSAYITVTENEHLTYTADSDLAEFGVQVAEGTVKEMSTNFEVSNTARLTMSGGNVAWIDARWGNPIVEVSGGRVDLIRSMNGATNITGGNIDVISSDPGSTVAVSGGSVTYLTAGGLQFGGSQQVAITGGTVDTLTASVSLSGDEQQSYTADTTLASFGVQVADGTVAHLVTGFDLSDSSRLTVSGGNVDYISARNSSGVNIMGGHVNQVYLDESGAAMVSVSGGHVANLNAGMLHYGGPQRVTITGGEVDKLSSDCYISGDEQFSFTADADLESFGVQMVEGAVTHLATNFYVLDNSRLTVSGGNIADLYVSNLRYGGPQRVTVTGGNVDTLRSQIILSGHDHLIYTTEIGLSDFGVQAVAGTVNHFNISLFAVDTSVLVVSGGSLESLGVEDNATVSISGGDISSLNAYGSSTVDISGGDINRLDVDSDSRVTILGGIIHELSVGRGTTLLQGFDFVLGEGLVWGIDGQTILGTGLLQGKWLDQTEPWTIDITYNYSGMIRAIPEPMTLSLLALGGVLMARRRK